ncbi:MAG: hypothetical protein H0S80_03190 [Desulfovibrionaceae bacterium]|nr:hypothetical protein [Desulfovibrionaceae bacterium]
MRHFSIIALIFLAVLFLTAPAAQAGNKFKNEDTAKDRQDNVFGTDPASGNTDISVGKDERGNTVIRSRPVPAEEKDWYDKVRIKVEPQVDWPKESTTTTTTTEETVDPSGDTTTTTTTSETKKETP